MQVPFLTTVSFADRDGTAIHLQYGISAGNEREARSELERPYEERCVGVTAHPALQRTRRLRLTSS